LNFWKLIKYFRMDRQTGQGTTRVYTKWWILFLAICFSGLQGLRKWLLTRWARRWRSLGTSIQTLFSAVHRATSPILHSGTWLIDSSIIETDGIIFHSVWQQKCNLLGKHGWFQFPHHFQKKQKKNSCWRSNDDIFIKKFDFWQLYF